MLLVCEGVARLVFWRSLDFDLEMWKYATQVKAVSPDPLLGHVHAANRRATLMGVDVATNAFGMRGADVTMAKDETTYRIAVFGDSFTMGWGVAENRTFVADLARRLNAEGLPFARPSARYEVLNFGVGNYNTVQEVELLRTAGLQFKPDLVLVAWFVNDAEPIQPSTKSYLLQKSYFLAFLLSRVKRLPVRGARDLDYVHYYRSLYEANAPGWRAAQTAFHELGDLGRANRIPIRVFLIPELHDLSESYPFRAIHDEVAQLGVEAGVPVLDLFPRFAGHSPELDLWVTPGDTHANATAHSMIANGMYEALRAEPAAAATSPTSHGALAPNRSSRTPTRH